jgi:hypothetical protein
MKRIALMESANRDWKDLSEAWRGTGRLEMVELS